VTSWEDVVRGRGEASAPTSTPEAAPPAGTATAEGAEISDEVVDPSTGELILLSTRSTDLLVDLILELRARVQSYTAWRKAAEAEIRKRLEAEGRRIAVVGDHELSVEASRGRAWDPDDLGLVVRELLDEGHLVAGEVTGLLRKETKVDGRLAQSLLGRLTGEPKSRLEGCFRWELKGTPKLQITPVPNLADALPEKT
jgi:hypothetical protein